MTSAAAQRDARGERRRGVVLEVAVAFGAGLLVAVVTTWPLARYLDTAARDTVDVPYEAWLLDWSGHAVTSGDSLLDANLFHPSPAASMAADPLWGLGIPLVPLRWLGLSALGVHNAVLLLAFGANAAAGYAAGRVVGGSVTIGALVAAALSFGPFHTAESGHIQILFHPVLGLCAVAAWLVADRLDRDERAVWPALSLGALLAWQVTISFYVAAYAAVVTAVVLALRLAWARRWPIRRSAAALVTGAAVPIAATLAMGAAYSRRSEPLPPLDEALRRVGHLSGDLVHAHPKLLVWGGLLGRGDGWFAITGAFPGLTLALLGVVGVALGWRSNDERTRRVARLAAALVVVGVVLALGAAESGPRSLLPWRWAMTLAPPLRGLRAANRGMLVALLGLGLGAGIAVSQLAARARQVRGAHAMILAVAVLLVVAEGLASWAGMPRLAPHAIDHRLAQLDEPGAVVYLPLPVDPDVTVADWGQAVVALRTTAHHRPTVNGYGGYFPPSYRDAKAALATFPGDGAYRYLRDNDVRFVVVDRAAAMGTPWEALAEPDGLPVDWLALVAQDETDVLYRVHPG